jgi:hypothetical protein
MSAELGEVVGQVVPYVTAAAGAYGGAVLERVREQAADATATATVGLGSRILRLLLGRSSNQPALEGAVMDVAEDPNDADSVAQLRVQLRKALQADPELLEELAALLPEAQTQVVQQARADRGSVVNQAGRDIHSNSSQIHVDASRAQGVQIGDNNKQINGGK